MLNTYTFKLNFTCPYTNEKRSRIDEYKATNTQQAIKGMAQYCDHNKNMFNATSKLIK